MEQGEESPVRADRPEPLWVQAADLIAEDVAAGRLPAGSRLPPERELCLRLGISRVTLRKALGRLVEDGVLASSHGRGWYVATSRSTKEWPSNLESFTETARRMGLRATSSVIRAEQAPASLDEAEVLGIAPGTPVFHLDRIRLLEDVPTAYDTTIVPAAILPDADDVDFATGSLYQQLDRAGAAPDRADSTIEATAADEPAASALGIEPGRPLLVLRQLVHGADGRAVALSTIRYVGDRYRLRTVFARGTGR